MAHKQRLGEGGTFFVLQTTPAVPDFHVWEQIDQHEAACKDLGGGQGVGFRVQGLRSTVYGLWFTVYGLRFRV